VKIEFEGRTWEFDQNTITIKQGVAIWYAHKLTIHEYLQALGKLDGRAVQVARWLMMQQNGMITPLADADGDAIAFMAAYGDAAQAEADAEQAAQDAQLDASDRGAAAVPTSPLPAVPPSPMSASLTATTQQPVQYRPPPPGYDPGGPIVS
jgi:hypothetical protein